MAYRIVSVDSTFSTATPDLVPNTPTLHASTNITISTSSLYTATYTATAGNQIAGCMIFVAAAGSGGTITITHQEDAGLGFADTIATSTVNITALSNLGWHYWRFASPFTYTTSTASKQRFRIIATTPTGTTSACAASGGANIMFFASDTNATTIQTTDDVFIINRNATGTVAFTVDGTQTIGSGTTTTLAASRQIGNALTVCLGSTVQYNTAASVSLTIKGNVVVFPTGNFLIGTSTTAYPIAYTATTTLNQNGTSGNYGICVLAGGIWKTYGAPKSSTSLYKTKLSSGTGTAADPAIMADSVDWSVGDRICIAPTSNNAANYNETEYRFIITKNSATSYVWSLTDGGAEAALTYSHSTDAWCLNLTRNVAFTTNNNAQGFYFLNYSTTAGNIVHNWTSFNALGTTAKSFAAGLYVNFNTATTAALDYCVATNQLATGGFICRASYVSETYTGNIVADCGALGATSGGFYITSSGNKNLVDCFVVDNERSGLYMEATNSNSFTRTYLIACNQDAGTDASTTYNNGAFAITYNSCEFHCNRTYGFSMGSSTNVFNTCLFGTKGTNTTSDIFVSSNGFTTGTFLTCSFGSGIRVSNYLNMSSGAELVMDTINSLANNHAWYNNRGTFTSSGSGLTDTTVRTAGTYNVRFLPENATDGLVYEVLVPARVGQAVSFFCFLRRNATFSSGAVTVELFLPGSLTADATYTMSMTTAVWEVASVAAYYSGTIPRLATIRITAKTATAGAYLYYADPYNGTNVITNLTTWYNGKPSTILFEQLGDAGAVWSVLTSTLTTTGTTGKMLVDTNILADDATALILSK